MPVSAEQRIAAEAVMITRLQDAAADRLAERAQAKEKYDEAVTDIDRAFSAVVEQAVDMGLGWKDIEPAIGMRRQSFRELFK